MEVTNVIDYKDEVFNGIKFNDKGYQNAFQCSECGKWLTLTDLRYINPEKRVCVKCLDKFQKEQKELAKEIKIYLSGELSE